MPGARCTHGPRAAKKHAAEPQVRAEQPAFPAQWFYGLYVISPVTRLCCHRRERIVPVHLTPALGRQDHTISPSAICCSSDNTPRPSHPAPNVRDDRDTPLLWVRDAREHGFDLPDGAIEKFASHWHDGQFAHGAYAARDQKCVQHIRGGLSAKCAAFQFLS